MTFRFIYVFCTIIVQENFFEKWRKKKKKLLQKSLKLWPSFNANYLRRKSSLFFKEKNHKIYFSERIKKRPWSFEREKCLGFVFFLAMIIMNRGFFTQTILLFETFSKSAFCFIGQHAKKRLYTCAYYGFFFIENSACQYHDIKSDFYEYSFYLVCTVNKDELPLIS